MDINQLLDFTIEKQASDLHLVPGFFPSIRINGQLTHLKQLEILTADFSKTMLVSLLNDAQKENLVANKEIDFGYEYKSFRFRVNLYLTRTGLSGSFRLIGSKIRTIEELSLPNSLHNFTKFNQGLVLITGPTGEGKSTTIAALINEINQNSAKHIITVEDPIEYVFPVGRSIISQRELHQDTHSWTIALRSALREDPDIVMIGEMRDYETIQAALTIAETGHLVFSTLHTGSTPEAINRIIDVFPSHQQNQVRSQLAEILKAVVAQRLVINAQGTNRIPALEILYNIPSIASVIREGKTHLIDNILETEEAQGLLIFEKYLAALVQKGLITRETAFACSIRPEEIKKFLK